MFSSLILENGMKKHIQNVARIKNGLVKLVMIFLFTFNACDYVIPSDFGYASQSSLSF